MYKVYLSGPISGMTFDGANTWRQYVEQRFIDTIIPLNPLRCKEFLRDHGILDGKFGAGSEIDHWMTKDDFIGTRDHWDTSRADVVFVNLLGTPIVSIGTVLEIGIAHAARVPVITVMEGDGSNIHEHCMLRHYSTMRFDNLDDAVDATNALLSV